MSTSKPPSRKGGKLFSDDDHAVWRHATRSIVPIAKGKPRKPDRGGRDAGEGQEATPKAAPKPRADVAKPVTEAARVKLKTTSEHVVSGQTTGRKIAAAAPPLAEIERRKVRKLGRGHVELDGRIDLHGMRQSEAHAALRSFLFAAHGRHARWVLVITGKGAPERTSVFERNRELDGPSQRGVLRRSVPRWLAEPELRAIVVGFTEASIPHGGSGALYVQLRARRRG